MLSERVSTRVVRSGVGHRSVLGVIGAVWGVMGLSLLLGWAVFRMALHAMELPSLALEWYHWLVLVVNTLFMAYSEGYKGFQLGASPRVAARVKYLYENPRLLHVVFAPLFCASYFYTTKRRQMARFILTAMIILLILIVSQFTQPWRGIVDVGVVVGLIWGILSMLVLTAQAMFSDNFAYSAELPE